MVDNSTFLVHVIFVLGDHEKSLYGLVPLKVNLYAYFVASVSEFLTKSSYVWHYYVVGGTGWTIGGCMWTPYVVSVVEF